MFGNEFAFYRLQNTVLNCVAVMAGLVWSRTEIKVDCRYKTEMQQLVTTIASCGGYHAPLRHCDYYNVEVQPADQTADR